MLNMFVEMNCHPIIAGEYTFNLWNSVGNLFVYKLEGNSFQTQHILNLGKSTNQNMF